jgi:hypothetical protein
MVAAVILGFFVIAFMISVSDPKNSPTPAPQLVSDDAELLISRCGKPDVDDSTAYDKPRPPIPSRFITYKKAHLMVVYLPGGGTKLNDPPPYKWKLLGLKDTRTGEAIAAADLGRTLRQRLPCFLPK